MTEPVWMLTARESIGVREIPGPRSNPTIMGWVKRLAGKLGIAFDNDDIPWCGLFVAHVLYSHGFDLPKIPVRASSWAGYGRQLVGPRPGCILVFTRSGGGHVGFYVGEDDEAFHVLGGNQSNSVNITRIAKSRLTAMRWPHGADLPPVTRVLLKRDGSLSTNEE